MINRYVEINRIYKLRFEGVLSENESQYTRGNASIMNADAKRHVGRRHKRAQPDNEKNT